MKAFAITIWAILAAIFVIAFASAWHSDDERNQKIEATTSPQEFMSLEIDEPKANVEVRRIHDSLLVKSSFTVELEKVIPGAFYKFRDINNITITATAAFSNDIRGHSRGRGDVLRATFSRVNAELIVWDHIVLDNLPQIADKFWQHPRLITDDSK